MRQAAQVLCQRDFRRGESIQRCVIAGHRFAHRPVRVGI